MSSKLNWLFRILGHGVLRRLRRYEMFLPDLTPDDLAIIRAVKGRTMTSPERIYGVINAVRYIAANKLPGALVECGVWKGGSIMAMALTLRQMGVTDRPIYLFDTFAGMTAPTKEDVTSFEPGTAQQTYDRHQGETGVCHWAYAPMEEVRRNVFSTGYPEAQFHFVVGPVEKTLPGAAPEAISLLRLDTDFYESTRAEMNHLFPRLVSGGVLILDDYVHWQGARQAVDEYVDKHKVKLLLNRLDYSGRIGVKL